MALTTLLLTSSANRKQLCLIFVTYMSNWSLTNLFWTENHCTFTKYRGQGKVDDVLYATDGTRLDHTSAFTQNGTRAFCEERCLSYNAEGRECWVWIYMQGSCVFYRSTSPLLPNLEALKKTQTTQLTMDFFFKECYNGTFVSSFLPFETFNVFLYELAWVKVFLSQGTKKHCKVSSVFRSFLQNRFCRNWFSEFRTETL